MIATLLLRLQWTPQELLAAPSDLVEAVIDKMVEDAERAA